MPLACATPVAEDESVGAPLCSLLMASLGLFKLNVATSLSADGAQKYLLIWVIVDLQVCEGVWQTTDTAILHGHAESRFCSLWGQAEGVLHDPAGASL